MKIEVTKFWSEGERHGGDIAEALRLISSAASILGAGSGRLDIEPAVWRLVDAAGLVARNCGPGELAGRDDCTGRGFRVVLIPTPTQFCEYESCDQEPAPGSTMCEAHQRESSEG